jgi:ribosomal protein S18 acetylase RimI-like enzyme
LGALLYSPLKQDKELPELIVQNFKVNQCVYIAEMMVTENSRSKGIGTVLLDSFFSSIDKKKYPDAFIRVWDQNQVAIGLYKKMGFVPYTQIDQVKNKVDGSGTYLMKKIYLHKKL